MLIWKHIHKFFEETELEPFLTILNTHSKRTLSGPLHFQILVASLNNIYEEEKKPLWYK